MWPVETPAVLSVMGCFERESKKEQDASGVAAVGAVPRNT